MLSYSFKASTMTQGDMAFRTNLLSNPASYKGELNSEGVSFSGVHE
jgi:hypothetical protein